MKPLPWSPSAIDTFASCPRQYHGKYILKDMPRVETEQQTWGITVHSAFEDRQSLKVKLPMELSMHEPYMLTLEEKPGFFFTEQQIGFTKDLTLCNWAHKADIWCRGVADYVKVDRAAERGTVVDYKTGKPHEKFRQLALYALFVFERYKYINVVNAQFYWTTTGTVTKKIWGRDDIPMLWGMFVADLKQYREAFKTDVWQPRQSGLCNGYCERKDCEFWRPLRNRR
jgi:hypothetical protein